jgi:hypothetical protein
MPTYTELPNVTHDESRREIRFRWMRPEVSDTRAVELSISHNPVAKMLVARLYLIDVHANHIRFTMDPGTSLLLRRKPIARYSRKALAAFADEVYAALMVETAPSDVPNPDINTLFRGEPWS